MSDEKREHDDPARGPHDRDPELDDLDDEARAALEEQGASVLDEVDVRELLRSALAPPKGAVAPELLQGVQRRIRTRSRGKFYGDGWSTAKSPRSTYLVTSLLMLVLIGFVFFVLVPWGGGALPMP
jgi:hypothetical protein